MKTMEQLEVQTAAQELKRELGVGSATASVAGEMIAVGIFLTPAEWQRRYHLARIG